MHYLTICKILKHSFFLRAWFGLLFHSDQLNYGSVSGDMYLFSNFDNEELNFLQNVDSDDFDWTLHSVCHLVYYNTTMNDLSYLYCLYNYTI